MTLLIIIKLHSAFNNPGTAQGAWIKKLEKSRIVPKKRRSLKNSDSFEKSIGGYVLRKPNIRRKIRILNSLIVPKNVKGGPLKFFNIHSVTKISKNWKGRHLGDIRKFSKKAFEAEKRGSLIVSTKVEMGALLTWNGFVFLVRVFTCVQNQVLSS